MHIWLLLVFFVTYINQKMEKLTLQIYLEQAWCDLAFLYFDSETYQLCNFEYLTDYVVQHYGKTGEHAVSLNYPVNVFIDDTSLLWSWLSDIAPAGASRRYWLDALDIKQESEEKQQFLLLKHAAISPIGNLRIKDAVPEQVEVRLFDLDKAKDRQSDFLEYVNQSGAMVGGRQGMVVKHQNCFLNGERIKFGLITNSKGRIRM